MLEVCASTSEGEHDVAGAKPDFAAIHRALDTNFFGAYRLTVELLGLLRESPHPRIVNVSSGMGGVAEMGGWSPGYRVSKAAVARHAA
jgi:NAD(P)-dependent dehydrogenase (short-subunit alcohol dehydrogenase family)